MRKIDGKPIFSPTDIYVFAESEFASWMDRCYLEDPMRFKSDEADPLMNILADKGFSHEANVLQSLRDNVRSFADLKEGTIDDTIRVMRSGVDLIYQAKLSHGSVAGIADFLLRVPGHSKFGNYCYEVWDSKLARSAKSSAVIQLCAYSEILEAIQGRRSENIGLIFGNGKEERFRTNDFFYYYAMVKDRFLDFQSRFDPNKMPHPSGSRSFGKWANVANDIFENEDSLFQVARITRLQVKRMNAAGIKTMTELSLSNPSGMRGVAKDVHQRLAQQAQLQISSKGKERPEFQCIPAAENKLSQLPPTDAGDIYFDMEGYPLDLNGLEYLWGYVYLDKGKPEFNCIWAHDDLAEKAALEKFLDYVHDRWLKFPGMHVYHYASYETRVIKNLAQRYGTRLDKLDDLLRNEIFVDLYNIVRGSFIIGTDSYSIKKVELLYRGKRSNEVTNAMASVVYYQNWLDLSAIEPKSAEKILDDIKAYNKDDCESTYDLAVWLQDQKLINKVASVPAKGPKAPKPTPDKISQLISDLEAKGDVGKLLGQLIGHYKREENVAWWEYFFNLKQPYHEIYHSPDFIAGVRYDGKTPTKRDRSLAYSFSFDPSQPLEAEVGEDFIFSFEENRNVKILEIDLENGTILAKTTEKEVPTIFDLIPATKIIRGLEEHVLDQARNYCSGEIHSALDDFLNRRAPRLTEGVILPRTKVEATTENITKIISAMRGTSLVIQGPPGAGKTFVGAHAIAELCRIGKRVGIMSNSHKAIDNLLLEAAMLLSAMGQVKRIVKVGGELETDLEIEKTKSGDDVEGVASIALVGGTAWAFVNENFEGMLDYLFIDEASQVCLANLVAVVKSTQNIVFLGDQMQLSQPSKASHPGDSGLSCLEFFLQANATIPLDLGIFLPITRRMHPSLCSLVSETVYEGRLTAHPSTADRFLISGKFARSITKQHGILYVPVEHEANRQSSVEEAAEVKKLVEELLQMSFQSSPRETRRLTGEDIIIVAPYNQQVRLLKRTLGDGFRIASVDKFQGQEAPVVILSLGTSSAHDAPRGLDFVFDKNRLNVALSRAKILAIVVGNPTLSSTFAQTPAQMSLVNFYCRIVQEGLVPSQQQQVKVS